MSHQCNIFILNPQDSDPYPSATIINDTKLCMLNLICKVYKSGKL